MLSNLEIFGWKKFRDLPKLDEAVGGLAESTLAVQGIFGIQIIFKLDKHVVLLGFNYIAGETVQINCLFGHVSKLKINLPDS